MLITTLSVELPYVNTVSVFFLAETGKLEYYSSMSITQSVLLGMIQGITEFLPVSSSGHLVVFRDILDVEGIPLLYDVLLHIATLMAIIFVFRRRIGLLLKSLFLFLSGRIPEEDRHLHLPNLRMIVMILIAVGVTAVIGLVVSEIQPRIPVKGVYVLFLVTAGILILGKYAERSVPYGQLTPKKSILIGAAQGFAALPGISRSGTTITVGMLCGLSRKDAAEVSFLVFIPAVIGALLLEVFKSQQLAAQVSPEALIAGSISSLVFSFLALKLLLIIIRGGRLYLFSIYLIPLGIYGLLFR